MNFKQAGVGLVELMIAVLLMSFIVLGLTEHYLAIKHQVTYLQQAMAKDIDLMLVSSLLRENIRMAGFTPCSSIENLLTPPLQNLQSLEMGPSFLKINRMSERFDTIGDVSNVSQVTIHKLETYHQNDSLLIADCYHAEVQTLRQIESLGPLQRLTFNQPLHFNYHEPVYIGEWLETSFEIQQSHGKGSLFYKTLHADELTQVVHGMAVSLKQSFEKKVVHVELWVLNSSPLVVDTSVRTL